MQIVARDDLPCAETNKTEEPPPPRWSHRDRRFPDRAMAMTRACVKKPFAQIDSHPVHGSIAGNRPRERDFRVSIHNAFLVENGHANVADRVVCIGVELHRRSANPQTCRARHRSVTEERKERCASRSVFGFGRRSESELPESGHSGRAHLVREGAPFE